MCTCRKTHTESIGVTFMSLGYMSGVNTLIATTLCGMQRIITTELFTPALLFRLTEKYAVTNVFLPAAFFALVVKHPDLKLANLSSIKQYWCGSNRVHRYLVQEMNKLLPNGCVYIKYGMTEVCGGITYNDPKLRPDSVGKLVAGMTMKIVDENGRRCGIGQDGEICYRSKYILLGFYGEEDGKKEAVDEEGFVRSGDFGHFDEDGFLMLIDRQTDLIGKGLVSVTVIENVIFQHRGVYTVVVVGLETGPGIVVPAAAIVRSDVQPPVTEQEINAFVKGITLRV